MAAPCEATKACHTTAAETVRIRNDVNQMLDLMKDTNRKVNLLLINGSITPQSSMEAAAMASAAIDDALDDSPPAVGPTSGTQSATTTDSTSANLNKSRRSRVPISTQSKSQSLQQEPVEAGTCEQPVRRSVSSSLSSRERSYQSSTNASLARSLSKN